MNETNQKGLLTRFFELVKRNTTLSVVLAIFSVCIALWQVYLGYKNPDYTEKLSQIQKTIENKDRFTIIKVPDSLLLSNNEIHNLCNLQNETEKVRILCSSFNYKKIKDATDEELLKTVLYRGEAYPYFITSIKTYTKNVQNVINDELELYNNPNFWKCIDMHVLNELINSMDSLIKYMENDNNKNNQLKNLGIKKIVENKNYHNMLLELNENRFTNKETYEFYYSLSEFMFLVNNAINVRLLELIND